MTGTPIKTSAVLILTLWAVMAPEVSFAEGYPVTGDPDTWRSAEVPARTFKTTAPMASVIGSLDGIENLIIDEFQGGVILRGELLTPGDMRRVVMLSESMENVLNLCTYHPEALALAVTHLKNILEQNRIIGLQLSTLGSSILLSGTPSEEGDVERIQRISASLHLPLINATRSDIADNRMVLFEVAFVEVNRDAFREMGFHWPGSTHLSDPNGVRIGHLKPSNALQVAINHQINKGNARILSRPHLVCASGQNASFQAGGEIPIPRTDSEGGISVSWKPYGIILEVAPSIDSKDKINVKIRSEVSMVDRANAVQGVPGILTRRVDTNLSLDMGQTVALSGLVHSDDALNVQKLPLLGDIPILGELFRSRSFQKRETELAVFLTPRQAPENPLDNDTLPLNAAFQLPETDSGPR